MIPTNKNEFLLCYKLRYLLYKYITGTYKRVVDPIVNKPIFIVTLTVL